MGILNKEWPITNSGLDMVEHVVQYVPVDAGNAITGAKLAKVEAEARDQAIEWLREALEMTEGWAALARAVVQLEVHRRLQKERSG